MEKNLKTHKVKFKGKKEDFEKSELNFNFIKKVKMIDNEKLE